ncbi:MAG: F0F1 ATP synthase subunit B [Ignavibacteriales bacterium]|nr:MAG: F0F1 ATP synthase subunit B [Ignavibacteriales bacterium]
MLAGITLGVLAASPEGGGTLLDVNPGLIIWTVITFVLLLLILKKVAWKPILTALDQRENAIKESLEKAEKAKDEAKKILDENSANLAKAEEESRKIIEQSRMFAEKLKEQMLHDSKEQAKKILDDATAEIERKKDAAFDELKTQVAQIAVNAAEKILKTNLDAEKNKKLADSYISEITKN